MDARHRYMAEVPASYRWPVHVMLDLALAGAVLVYAIASLRAVTGAELMAVPVGLLSANVAEYLLHRYPMHRPMWPLRFAYRRHGVVHHSVFTYEDMGMRSPRELRWVLFPVFTVPGLLLMMLPIAAATGAAVSANAGWLTLAVTSGYYLLYELLHTAYHLPRDSSVARQPLIAWLRSLHQVHHDPRLMTRYNFNVTLPIADALFGTWRRTPARSTAELPA